MPSTLAAVTIENDSPWCRKAKRKRKKQGYAGNKQQPQNKHLNKERMFATSAANSSNNKTSKKKLLMEIIA
jgi:hypothetical protein